MARCASTDGGRHADGGGRQAFGLRGLRTPRRLNQSRRTLITAPVTVAVTVTVSRAAADSDESDGLAAVGRQAEALALHLRVQRGRLRVRSVEARQTRCAHCISRFDLFRMAISANIAVVKFVSAPVARAVTQRHSRASSAKWRSQRGRDTKGAAPDGTAEEDAQRCTNAALRCANGACHVSSAIAAAAAGP